MTKNVHANGGAPVAVLNRMDAWEANLVLNLRLWCQGPRGQSLVLNEYRKALPGPLAQKECHTFERLIRTVISAARRPMVRRDVGCGCVGSDEAVFVNLVRTASAGELADAALIATLLVGPAQAEQVAMMAGYVGETARSIHRTPREFPLDATTTGVRIH